MVERSIAWLTRGNRRVPTTAVWRRTTPGSTTAPPASTCAASSPSGSPSTTGHGNWPEPVATALDQPASQSHDAHDGQENSLSHLRVLTQHTRHRPPWRSLPVTTRRAPPRTRLLQQSPRSAAVAGSSGAQVRSVSPQARRLSRPGKYGDIGSNYAAACDDEWDDQRGCFAKLSGDQGDSCLKQLRLSGDRSGRRRSAVP
jgi:hypothetical protein